MLELAPDPAPAVEAPCALPAVCAQRQQNAGIEDDGTGGCPFGEKCEDKVERVVRGAVGGGDGDGLGDEVDALVQELNTPERDDEMDVSAGAGAGAGSGGGGGGGSSGGAGAGDVEELSETMSQASVDSKASGNPAPRKKGRGGGSSGGAGAGDVEELSETMSQASLDSKASGNPAPRKKGRGGGAFGAGMGLERQEVRGCILLLLFMLSKRNVYAFIQALGEDETTEAGDESRPRGLSQIGLSQIDQYLTDGKRMMGRGLDEVIKHTYRLNKFVAEANGGGGGGGGGGSSGGTGAPAPAPAGE
jgi:hypothetical protein